MLIKSNEQILMKNGILTTPFPKINLVTKNSLLKIDYWLYENAIIQQKNEYSLILIKAINPKKMTISERDFLNFICFDKN